MGHRSVSARQVSSADIARPAAFATRSAPESWTRERPAWQAEAFADSARPLRWWLAAFPRTPMVRVVPVALVSFVFACASPPAAGPDAGTDAGGPATECAVGAVATPCGPA